MDIDTILKQVNDILKDILEDDNIKLLPSTVAKEIHEWDSLNHIIIIVAIEKHFKIRFKTSEINNWENVGAMCEAIYQRLQTSGRK